MSATTDADGDAASTATYKSVASIGKLNVAHDIVIKDFKDWRNNAHLLGELKGTLELPIPDDEGESKVGAVISVLFLH